MSTVPTRQDPLGLGPAPIADELRAQLDARADRRRAANRAKRPKATYDLSEAVQARVNRIAARESIAACDVVALAIVRFAAAYEAGAVDLAPLKRAARSLKFAYRLELPAEE